jgi:hypothetical protein
MKIVFFAFALLILSACTLSADQEQKLNQAVSAYLHARNDCQIVNYVAFTHPSLVAKFKEEGDSVFQTKFDCTMDSLLLEDPTIRTVEKEGNDIQVLFDITAFDEYTYQQTKEKQQLVAISSDQGKSWFFIDYGYYVDKTLLPSIKRLIKK